LVVETAGYEWHAAALKTWQQKRRDGGGGQAPKPRSGAALPAGLYARRRLLAQGDISAIRYYPYRGIGTALDDLEAGRIGLVIKLFPVISWLTRKRPGLTVAMHIPTDERLGIAYAPGAPISATPSAPPLRHCARAASSQSCRPPGPALAPLK